MLPQVGKAASPGSTEAQQLAAALMFSASDDDRGTVQALARDIDKAHEDGMSPCLSQVFPELI